MCGPRRDHRGRSEEGFTKAKVNTAQGLDAWDISCFEMLKNADEDAILKKLRRCAIFIWKKEKYQRLD